MTESPTERARRLRWLTLAELVGVAAVTISALALWNGWRGTEADRTTVIEQRAAVPLTLRAERHDDGDSVALVAVEPGHALQSVEVAFPSALKAGEVSGTGELRLSASDFDDALIDARDARKAPKESAGERRLPLLVTSSFIENGATRVDRAMYALAYRVKGGGLLGSRKVKLGGLSLIARGGGATQAALDRRWAGQKL